MLSAQYGAVQYRACGLPFYLLWKISPFCLGGALSAMTAWGGGQAHIPRRAGGERFVIPSFPAGVCLALPIVCVLDAGFILDALPSLAFVSCL